jgi:dihydropyrimidinase
MEIMEAVKDTGMLKIHAEAYDIIKKCEKRMDEQNRYETVCHSLTRPNIAELLSVRDMIALQRMTGAHICIAHVSSKDTIEEKAREMALDGPAFTIETCPHYLAFTRERMREEDGALYTMAPPLRSREDSDAIWQGILDGRVDFMATDHCPFSAVHKLKPGLNYHNLPYGVDGIQTRLLYLFSEGVKKRGLSMERFVQLTSENTAKNYKIYPQKGCIAIGSDADIVCINPDEKWIYGKDEIIGSCDYTIFEGWEFEGKIDKVFSRGELVYDSGEFNAQKGRGQFVRCQ